MSIVFSCPSCGTRFSVPESTAGRKGRCKKCGEAFEVPSPTIDDDPYSLASTGTYDVAEAEEAPAHSVPTASTFVSTRSSEPRPAPPRAQKARSEPDKPPIDWSSGRVRTMLTVPIVLVLVLGIASRFIPNGSVYAAWGLTGLGILTVVIGWGIGAYVAFSEDALYGLLYVIFAPYAGYYIVTRWDEMWPWFATTTAGVVILTVAGWLLESLPG